MPNYRRAFVQGGCWFFTVNLLSPAQPPFDRSHCSAAGGDATCASICFTIDAMVVLPDHLHAVWTLPTDDTVFHCASGRSKLPLPKPFPSPNREVPSAWREANAASGSAGSGSIYDPQRRGFPPPSTGCYINPVKHGLVGRVRDWPHSSFHRDVREGLFSGRFGWATPRHPATSASDERISRRRRSALRRRKRSHGASPFDDAGELAKLVGAMRCAYCALRACEVGTADYVALVRPMGLLQVRNTRVYM